MYGQLSTHIQEMKVTQQTSEHVLNTIPYVPHRCGGLLNRSDSPNDWHELRHFADVELVFAVVLVTVKHAPHPADEMVVRHVVVDLLCVDLVLPACEVTVVDHEVGAEVAALEAPDPVAVLADEVRGDSRNHLIAATLEDDIFTDVVDVLFPHTVGNRDLFLAKTVEVPNAI